MIPELRLLYNKSAEQTDMMRWLGDRDLIKEYKDTMRFLSEDGDRLLEVLSEKDKELFQRYMENRNCQLDLECEIYFSMGAAMGLRLGALCLAETI